MSITLKRIICVAAALVMALAAIVTVTPVRASAASEIKYTVEYVGDKVQLTLTAQKSSNTIYYTANGKKPTTSSTKYNGALQANGKAKIRAIEVTKKGKQAASLTLTIQPRVQPLSITVKETSSGLKLLKVSTATAGASIYYTINGTDPTKKSYPYQSGNEPIYTEGTVFKFRAYKSGMQASEIAAYGDLPAFNEASPDEVPPEAVKILELVNAERTSRGLSELKLDADLMEAANIRAKELATTYDHTRPDGSSCFTVLDELGIAKTTTGENIGMGQKLPETVMDNWMHSKKHKANILGESFTRLGVGHYEENGVNYWAQMFLR